MNAPGEPRRWRCLCAYDGTAFNGWQKQSNRESVQDKIENSLAGIFGQPIRTIGAGRTDAGVHASGQVAAFSSAASRELHDWQRGLNGLTPAAVRINWIKPVDDTFHPRYSAVARRYVYLFHDIGFEDPLVSGRAWQCSTLDVDAMHRSAQILVGEHDFSSFRGAGCQSLTPMRRVNHCIVRRHGHWVSMDIQANAFVLHMVRNIAAGLYGVGTASADISLEALLAARDRTLLGPTAPPQGLYLTDVSYPRFDLPDPAPLAWLAD